MRLSRPAGILLDLDETLFDNSFVEQALEPACDAIVAHVRSLDRQLLLDSYDVASARIWPEAGPRCITGEAEALDVSHEVWRVALDVCGSPSPELVDFAHEQHQQTLTQMSRIFDDVPDFLSAIDRAGISTAIVTNGSSGLQASKLAAVGLEGRFAAVVISGEVGTAKPDPGIFEIALDRLGVRGAAVWHVGDSLASDIAGARAAGVSGVWLNRNAETRLADDPVPVATVRSLTELAGMLGA